MDTLVKFQPLGKSRILNKFLYICENIKKIDQHILHQYTPHRPSVLTCQSCMFPITSKGHRDNCFTITMWTIRKIITPDFKPMMTYGLGSCTALLMVFFIPNTTIVNQIIFGHHPIKEDILKWFSKYYTKNYNIVTIIKTPGDYIKEGGEWKIITENKEYWEMSLIKDNCKLIIESYSLYNGPNDTTHYNSSLYFTMREGIPNYSDNYGRRIKIQP